VTYIGPVLVAIGIIAWAWKESLPRRDGRAIAAAVILVLLALAAWFMPEITDASPVRIIARLMEGLFPLHSHTPVP